MTLLCCMHVGQIYASSVIVCACLSEQHMIRRTRILRKLHSCQSCISGFLKGVFSLLKAQTKLVILAVVFLWLAGVIGASGSVLLHCEAARFSNTPVDPGVFQMHTRPEACAPLPSSVKCVCVCVWKRETMSGEAEQVTALIRLT